MRRLTTVLFAAALAAAPLAAQSWHPEIGVEGGFARLKPAGTNARDQVDFFDVPGAGFLFGTLTYSSLYAIIPLHDKIALEPSFAASEMSLSSSGEILTARFGARADYAITSHIYAGLGAELLYVMESSSGNSRKVGPLAIQAAAGYRFALTSRLNGRVEAHWAASKASRNSGISIGALDVYGLLFGVSARVGGPAPARGARRAASEGAWEPALGLSGGYFSTHLVGGGTFVGLSVPGVSSGAVALLGEPLPQTATMFAIIPVSGKLAIEPGLNFDRAQEFGFFETISTATLSARADYAVGRSWYAGLGPVANYFKITGFKGAAQLGVTAAWGYRFHMTGDLGGRLEASYSLFAKHRVLGVPPANVLGLGAGVTMAL